MNAIRLLTVAAVGLLLAPGSLVGQAAGTDDDTQMGRFDFGKMWTFEYAPMEYFSSTYDFEADQAWFDQARLSVLRIPGCSASFVSPNGLVVTNHHCVRSRVSAVSGEGEGLLDNGFFATDLADERPIPGYFADQLISVNDVSDEILAVLDAVDEAGRSEAQAAVSADITARLLAAHPMGSDSVWVQIVPLYNGGRYSAYVFRRFTDVRLVAAAELNMGFFGGDPDNFTYPRYALDFAFLRVYGDDGEPFQPTHYFKWGDGVAPEDPVFIIGNPGRTNRQQTVAQLEYQRDVQVPSLIQLLASRHQAMKDFRAEDPETAEELDLRNSIFGLSNSLKASLGRIDALGDDMILARKGDADRQLGEGIAADPELAATYGDLFDQIAEVQAAKMVLANEYGAFLALGSNFLESSLIRRTMAASAYIEARNNGATEEQMAQAARNLTGIAQRPSGLERRLLATRLADFGMYLPDSDIAHAALEDHAPDDAAAWWLENSRLASEDAAEAIVAGEDLSDDPAMLLAAVIAPLLAEYREASQALGRREANLSSDLGRARIDVYGGSIPPDGSSSPRIADGRVRGYSYNGTMAPPMTTFYGVYDRFHGHDGSEDWELPARWQSPPEGLDLSTPLNFVSTTDSYGGNSGSPAVTPDLEVVGLNFDRNIEGLSRDYIYLPDRGRNVMVDVRAIRAALDVVYDLDRIVEETKSGRLYRTEAEADAAN
jgi:hypothetical protein